MTRICIVGPSRTGKTTLSAVQGVPVRHTDDLLDHDPRPGKCTAIDDRAVAEWFDDPGPWCIEGVAVTRGLREWLRSGRRGRPCDEVVRLTHPWVAHTPGQATQAKGEATVWAQVEAELRARGVSIR